MNTIRFFAQNFVFRFALIVDRRFDDVMSIEILAFE